GGVPNDGKSSIGFTCDSSSTALMTSNLISGGVSTTHRMIDNASSCTVAVNFHNNYLWYAANGGESGGEAAHVVATNGNLPDNNGNLVGETVGCYDGSFAQPDYHLAAGSPCTDKGAAAQARKDTSAITLDVDGNARKLGAATDVGCSE